MIYVIKKDGTKEEFNSKKIVAAVNKSAARILSASLPRSMQLPWEKMRSRSRRCTT